MDRLMGMVSVVGEGVQVASATPFFLPTCSWVSDTSGYAVQSIICILRCVMIGHCARLRGLSSRRITIMD
jgi:hypothetical protein